MENTIAILVGIGLAAACGFRVFVPFFVMSLAAQTGHLSLAPSLDWLATPMAAAALGTASLVEIAAYYTPWLDHLLDTVAGPAAVVAGALAAASVVTDMSPFLKWSVAIIAGGGAAGILQSTTTALRLGSTATTGGFGNPVVATGEIVGASVVPVLAVTVPIICLVVLALFVGFMWTRTGRLITVATRRAGPRRPG